MKAGEIELTLMLFGASSADRAFEIIRTPPLDMLYPAMLLSALASCEEFVAQNIPVAWQVTVRSNGRNEHNTARRALLLHLCYSKLGCEERSHGLQQHDQYCVPRAKEKYSR